VGKIFLNILEIRAREALECYKVSLMCDSSRFSESQNTNRNVNSKAYVHEISDGNKNLIKN
jgi:hypothetical protein